MDGWNIALNVLNIVLLIIFGLFLKSYLPSYFEQKGKNLATKEDIEEITERTERARQRQQHREEKVKKVTEQLSRFGKVIELYALFPRPEKHTVSDKIRGGEKDIEVIAVEEHIPEHYRRLEQAVEALEGVDLKSAIDQKIVEIYLEAPEAIYLSRELDASGELEKKFQHLHWLIKSMGHSIEDKNYEKRDSYLRQARDIYSELQSHLNDGR